MKRKYEVQVTVTATLEIDDEVLAETLTKDWQDYMFPISRREDAVEHIAFNMLRGANLSIIDGYAHRRDDQARVSDVDWSDWDVRVVPTRKTRGQTRPRKRAA